MKSLNRNKQPLWYALYSGKTAVVDTNGYKTGEYELSYETPVSMPMNVSRQRRYATIEPYGVSTDYEVIAVTDDMDCPITETSVIWIGANPSTHTKHTHMVTAVSKSLNSVTYTLKEVDAP